MTMIAWHKRYTPMDAATVNQIRFTDADVVNPEDFIPEGEYNPHKVHGFLLHDHGYAGRGVC